MDTRVIAACVVVAAALGACRRSPVESPNARVDALFAEWNKPDSPGCSVGVSQSGTVVYEHGYGMGNLVGMVKFSRDARGDVIGFTVNANDVRGLRFERK